MELTDSRVTVKAYAYRTPEDARPGIGHSSLEIPGRTPYTKGSEIENCETSAWGRAIAALGFEVKRGISSAEEVRNKQSGQGEPRHGARGATPATQGASAPAPTLREELARVAAEKDIGVAGIEQYADLLGFPKGERLADDQLRQLIAAVKGHGTEQELDLGLPDLPQEPTASPEPPKPGTDEYKGLPAHEKAGARAYWEPKVTA